MAVLVFRPALPGEMSDFGLLPVAAQHDQPGLLPSRSNFWTEYPTAFSWRWWPVPTDTAESRPWVETGNLVLSAAQHRAGRRRCRQPDRPVCHRLALVWQRRAAVRILLDLHRAAHPDPDRFRWFRRTGAPVSAPGSAINPERRPVATGLAARLWVHDQAGAIAALPGSLSSPEPAVRSGSSC